MVTKDPSSQTTLVILLGASQWPSAPEFINSNAFANSARAVKDYFLSQQKFGLPDGHLLDLFDDEGSADDLDMKIQEFLSQRLDEMREVGTPAKDLVVYFVGHGSFFGPNQMRVLSK